MDWDDANAEYQATVADFPFPLMGGDEFPADMGEGGSDLYQHGWGEGQAYFYWMCSVERHVLETMPTDPDAAYESVEALRQVVDTTWFATYFEDPEHGFEREVIDKSALGDTSVMREQYDTDCRWYRQVNGL
ncbi:hypothetical protein KIH73_02755 [Bifidobacterium sp. 6T3]|uniref:Uncharacterized protein n=2 Tax=Bifidobacterium phasiani TaxID=2834431 RepID=A0ABS6W990_9BIFI|nr:hypothetical protein [Bifidobacterium phasiani]